MLGGGGKVKAKAMVKVGKYVIKAIKVIKVEVKM